MRITNRYIPLIVACFIAAIMTSTKPVGATDFFTNMAINPMILRDFHEVSTGSERIAAANTSNGQNTGIAYQYLFTDGNLWNDERNQLLAGIQYGRRELDSKLALPDGFAMPTRLDNASVSIGYKHITSGDWSINQTVHYNQSWTDSSQVTVQDTFDLIGLAVVATEPGIAWAFGYLYAQTDSLSNQIAPVVEYVDNSHEKWSIMLGFPLLSGTYSPHPDWGLGGGSGIAISYKVTQQNFLRLSISGNNWAYRLEGPNAKGVAYAAQRVGLDWTYWQPFDYRTDIVLNASLGLESNRQIGSENQTNKLSLDNAAVAGFSATLTF